MEIPAIDGQLGGTANGTEELQLKEDVQDFYNFRMHLETLSKEELMEACLQLYKEKKHFEQYIQAHQLAPRRQRPKIRNPTTPIVEQLPVPPPNNPFATALFMDCTKVTECYLQVRWYFQRHWNAEKHNDILSNAKSERKIEEKELLVLVYVKDEYLHPQHVNIPTYQILQDLKGR